MSSTGNSRPENPPRRSRAERGPTPQGAREYCLNDTSAARQGPVLTVGPSQELRVPESSRPGWRDWPASDTPPTLSLSICFPVWWKGESVVCLPLLITREPQPPLFINSSPRRARSWLADSTGVHTHTHTHSSLLWKPVAGGAVCLCASGQDESGCKSPLLRPGGPGGAVGQGDQKCQPAGGPGPQRRSREFPWQSSWPPPESP